MKVGLRSIFFLILIAAIACSIVQRRFGRQTRILNAVAKLKNADLDDRNPIATSDALRYLRHIGIDETEDAIRRFDSETHIPFSIFKKLPFLFETSSGCPALDQSCVYSNGLIFDTFRTGLQGSSSLDEFDFSTLRFSDRSFTPPDDLANTCESVVNRLVAIESADIYRQQLLTMHVYSQAGEATEHLYSNDMDRYNIDHVIEFLQRNGLKWNPDSKQYEISPDHSPEERIK